MRIMIMGAGALGCYIGARLGVAGHAVELIARGAHLEAMQRVGLRVESPLGDIAHAPITACATPEEAGPADVIFLMVKNFDLETAAALLLPVLRPSSVVVTVQNGITAPDRLAALIGPERVIPGIVFLPADVKAPGVVRHSAPFNTMTLGPVRAGGLGRSAEIAEAFEPSGIKVTLAEDIEVALWQKFIMLSSLSALTCITRLDIGPVRDTPQTAALLRAAIDEATAVGRAVCPGLAADEADKAWAFLTQTVGANVHASMLDDLQRGKRLELNYLSGDVARLGQEHGVPTPTHDFVTAALQPLVDGAP